MIDLDIISSRIEGGHYRHLFIDVGLSYDAPHSREWLGDHKDSFVIGIEPNPKSIELLRRDWIPESASRFLLLPCGIANVEEEELRTFNDILDVADTRGTSSFLEPTAVHEATGAVVQQKLEVPVISLKMILDRVPWDRFDTNTFTLKSDTQGYECEVLHSLGGYIHSMEEVQVENGTNGAYEGAPEYNEIASILFDAGFDATRHYQGNSWFKKK